MKLNLVTFLIGVIGLLITSVSIQTCRVNKAIKQREIAEVDRAVALQFANNEKQKTESYVNKFNNVVARTKTIEVSLTNVQALRNTERLQHLKQFDALKKKLNNLEQSIVIDATINKDSIPFRVIYLPCKDSIKAFHYELIDEWNNINAMVLDTPKFEIKVPIQSVVYWQRKRKLLWFRIGRKEWFMESTSPNTLVDITSQDLIKVSKK